MSKKTFISFIIGAVVLGGTAGLITPAVFGQAADIEISFGGNLIFHELCDCSENYLMVYMVDETSILIEYPILTYSPYSTILYEAFDPLIDGTDQAGLYLPGVDGCYFYVGYGCYSMYTSGMITNLAPAAAPKE